MSTPVPKMLGMDLGAAKPQPFIASMNGVAHDRFKNLGFRPKHEYMRFDNPRTLIQPDYCENATDGKASISVNGTKWSIMKAPPPGSEPSHDPIPDEGICEACEDIEIRSLLGLGGGRKHYLGSAAKLLSCSGCGLCRMFTAAFEIETETTRSELAKQYPNAFVIMTSHWATHPVGPVQDRIFELAARIITFPGHVVGESRIRLLADDAFKVKRSSHMRGRMVESRARMSLARSWLTECEENHDCGLLVEHQKPKNSEEKLFVLDIEQLCLVEIPQNSRYLVLSYVWPRLPSIKLFRNLFEEWKRPQALSKYEGELLNVFQDAIAVTAALGERYIWIDQLCMAQDDPALKDYLVNKMDKVYGQAVLNIVVATSTCPQENYHIPGVTRARAVRQEAATIDGLRFAMALPDYSSALGRTWWATRGWTFQEGVLPKRCLIFHDDQMYFRCYKDSRSEDVTAEGNTQFEFHPAKPKVQKGGFEHYMNPGFLSNISNENCFEEYGRYVRDYSRRSLTHGGDILPAFKGILTVLFDVFETLFFCGMPLAYFHRALLWYPAESLKRRETEISEGAGILWPSWSWPGWVGRIDHELDILHLGDARSAYPTVCWYRYNSQHNSLLAIWGTNDDMNESPDPPFALGLLYNFVRQLCENPTRIIGWVSTFKISLDPNEKYIFEWLTDLFQSVPCFSIVDVHGESCGYLPSVDRDWARRYREDPTIKCEMIILPYAQQSAGDEQYTRIDMIHSKYKVIGNPMVCFYYIMLIERDCEGIAYRRGAGRIHIDAVNELDSLQYVQREPCLLG